MLNRTAQALALLAIALTCAAPSPAQQLQGRLYLDKTRFIAGEPIYLHSEIKNVGGPDLQLVTGDPYGCGGFDVSVRTAPKPPHSTCMARGGAVSCIIGGVGLDSGATHSDDLLLNFAYDFSKPGVYTIDAKRYYSYQPPDSRGFWNPEQSKNYEVDQTFQVEVTAADSAALAGILAPYQAQLSSKDELVRREAERAIGSAASPTLEDAYVSWLKSSESAPFAILALSRLNTVKGRAALADYITQSPRFEELQRDAIEKLAATHDATYFPLLAAQAEAPDHNSFEYPTAAAMIGGDQAVPWLKSELNSKNEITRGNVMFALPATGSREAFPILLHRLLDPNPDTALAAERGLIELTHRSTLRDGDPWSNHPAEDFGAWSSWWTKNGSDAPMYRQNDCGEVMPLQ